MGRRVVRTLILVIGATPFALGGCGSGEIGDARTAVELAPSVQPLQEVAPDHYRRLADSTFDSLSLVEQWDFVSEVDEIVGRHWETESAEYESAWRRSIVDLLDTIETLPPETAKQRLALQRGDLLWSLKRQNDALLSD